jgi:hypothetical protein
MKNPTGAVSIPASAPAHSKKPSEPNLPSLAKMPNTPEELFRSLALTVTTTVSQPEPSGKSTKKQDYALPWMGFRGWRDARERLNHFEKGFKGKIEWAPFNDSTANDGPMSLNSIPGRAFIERVTNEGDANLEANAANHKGPMPESPVAAAAAWFGLGTDALSTALTNDQVLTLAKETVTVAGWVGDPSDPRDLIFDARDYGIGLTAAEMPSTILSLNRGNKKSKHWLTGKHGQGASSTYQYTDLTLIASRKIGANKVAFTLVEATWNLADHDKTPTYRYLVIDGKVPEVTAPEDEFQAGTLVRHIGYNAAALFNLVGENSLYGLLMRSLAEPLFPVWLEIFSLRAAKAEGYPTFPGYRRYGRVIRGTVNALERAYAATLKVSATDGDTPMVEADADDAGDPSTDPDEKTGTKVLHRNSEFFQLPNWDFGGREGVGELGRVRITYWVVDPGGRSSQGVLRNWVDPDKTILMTLDGQTHAEESRAVVTGQTGAKLWAVGKFMIVQVDCNDLDPRAKYEMFTSTREHAKETPIKKMILEELVRRLGFDTKLQDLNVKLAAADIGSKNNDNPENIASLIKKYLKAAGINFEQLTRRVEKWITTEEEQKVKAGPKEPIPIEAHEPPTFIRWRFSGAEAKMHPGQRYSFVFETDAAPSYWNPENPLASKIKVTAHEVRYVGSGEMKGGRVRCHFECAEDAVVGTKAFIQVQLEYAPGAAITNPLPIEIVAKPEPKEKKGGKPNNKEEKEDGDSMKVIRVKIRKKDFTEVDIPVVKPIPVKTTDTLWGTLGWPHDPHRVGFSIRSLTNKIHLYYNAEFPPFLDLRHRMSKKSLEDEFIRRYELKLVLHTIFTLNYDFVDEDDFSEEQRKRVRDLLCATAESLALATKSELEIEAKLKSEESTPLETAVAADLQQATVQEPGEATNGAGAVSV